MFKTIITLLAFLILALLGYVYHEASLLRQAVEAPPAAAEPQQPET